MKYSIVYNFSKVITVKPFHATKANIRMRRALSINKYSISIYFFVYARRQLDIMKTMLEKMEVNKAIPKVVGGSELKR